jgi:uncharacterized phage protein (TIGR02218 family)
MSAWPQELFDHLEGEATTLCQCWRVTRRDGAVSGFTDHDRTLTVDGTAFSPRSGFSASEARETLGLAADTVDVEGALSSDDLDPDDIAAGRYDGASVETLLVNWRHVAQFAVMRRAVIGRITVEDGRFVAELESPKLHLDRPAGRWFRRGCDAELGDARCGVDVEAGALNGAGTVTAAVSGNTIAVAGLDGFDGGWFSHGTLTAAGTTFRIVSHRIVGASVELELWRDVAPMPGPGAACTVKAGCDKSFATCKAKFANHLNFRGFPHLPGNDAAYGYAREGEVFDGSPLVP